MTFRKAGIGDVAIYTDLAGRLWPDAGADELEEEFLALADDDDSAVFLAIEEGVPLGFAHCQIRHDYVEGAISSPVGYIEGIYVIESHRNKGVAKDLLDKCEDWARSRGILEMASDCEVANEDSIAFHKNVGFKEANRVVCFIKNVGRHI